jgi:hypothetical protein
MKKYILFAGYEYYPSGGAYDFRESSEKLNEFKTDLEELKEEKDWIHILDVEDGKIVKVIK